MHACLPACCGRKHKRDSAAAIWCLLSISRVLGPHWRGITIHPSLYFGTWNINDATRRSILITRSVAFHTVLFLR